ncbi:exported protein of unknown function [Nitrospira defluvii]|jgi:hypothetical protein|uniref:Uncharacterized protein n=1 Tax=Nitrospira defluvii TaxID=330214 RepID=D8PA68_9BACT|nr:exported protein of unknown function [Nitrospira defluvii]
MNKLIAGLITGIGALQSTNAFANVSEGPPDYSGITGLYYTLIALILGFGVYDTFFKKS